MSKLVFISILIIFFVIISFSSANNIPIFGPSEKDVDYKPTLHMIGLFHTITNNEYSHCAFTGKVLKFSKMMQMYGWKIIEYGNAYTESGADEFVQMLTEEELRSYITKKKKTEFVGNDAVIGTTHHMVFEERLIPAMRKRLKDGDIVLHPFGKSHSKIASLFSNVFHIESGIGYPDPFLSIKVFESYAVLHYYYGSKKQHGENYNFVIPNYFNPDDWTFSPTVGDDRPIVYMGRITREKGLETVREIVKKMPHRKFKIAGQGNFTQFFDGLPNAHYYGALEGNERSEFLKGAVAMLLPTLFVEPFGGSIVEGQFCGVPGITVNYGVFAETIEHGVTGFRCNTLGDWINAIEEAEKLDRKYIRDRAVRLYSYEAVGKRYDAVFRQVYDLRDGGWYKNVSYNVYRREPGMSACS
eukprot:TRINITY_DN4808_c0_g1_i1.p1 TRINITY_DN4808_c0_g1~~TRINITY_DN4808_c0_g1_i1.p1  ORF type:complete len:413 (+),score=95.32 TRINITY_DN4808_c0_g1_i1:46-1284(+)